jgi:hypothetical protein
VFGFAFQNHVNHKIVSECYFFCERKKPEFVASCGRSSKHSINVNFLPTNKYLNNICKFCLKNNNNICKKLRNKHICL